MSPRPARPNDFDEFVKRSLFVAALVGLGILLWFLWGVLLLIFAGALLAIAIRDLAMPFARWTPLGTGGAIALVVILLLVVLSGTGLVLGTQLIAQLGELWTRLPEFAGSARQFIGQAPIGRTVLQLLPDWETIFRGITAGSALTAATTTLGVVANVLIVIFLALFFALTPRLYTRGLVALLPPAHRARGQEVLAETAKALRAWLRGQFVAMIAVGSLLGSASRCSAFLLLSVSRSLRSCSSSFPCLDRSLRLSPPSWWACRSVHCSGSGWRCSIS